MAMYRPGPYIYISKGCCFSAASDKLKAYIGIHSSHIHSSLLSYIYRFFFCLRPTITSATAHAHFIDGQMYYNIIYYMRCAELRTQMPKSISQLSSLPYYSSRVLLSSVFETKKKKQSQLAYLYFSNCTR